MSDLILRGSQTAKNGFKNEQDIAYKFNNWKTDDEAKVWLLIMNYKHDSIEWVKAIVIHGHKADLNVQIQVKLKKVMDIKNIQVKLVSSKKGFNQVDKRWLCNYDKMWNIPDYSEGTVCMSPKGSIILGRVGIQRKGGDNGRDTANMLQFKVDPADLFDIL